MAFCDTDADMVIEQNNVHVWQVSLARDPAKRDCFDAILDKDEKERAARFHFPKDRARFVVARASLRLILAGYLKEPPDQIRFSYGPNGKPELRRGGLEPRLHFNLSHSHDLALLAVVEGRQVGVDVEKIIPQVACDLGIADNFFTPCEAELVRAAPDEIRADVFYRLWTRKEAYLKACGDGLSAFMNRFGVSLQVPEIWFADPRGGKNGNWSVHEFRPCPGYVGAVAIEGVAPSFSFFAM